LNVCSCGGLNQGRTTSAHNVARHALPNSSCRFFSRIALKRHPDVESTSNANAPETAADEDIHLSGRGWYIAETKRAIRSDRGTESSASTAYIRMGRRPTVRSYHAEGDPHTGGGSLFARDRRENPVAWHGGAPDDADPQSSAAVLVHLLQALAMTKSQRLSLRFLATTKSIHQHKCIILLCAVQFISGFARYMMCRFHRSKEQESLRLFGAVERQRLGVRFGHAHTPRRSSISDDQLPNTATRSLIKQALIRFLTSTPMVVISRGKLSPLRAAANGARAPVVEARPELYGFPSSPYVLSPSATGPLLGAIAGKAVMDTVADTRRSKEPAAPLHAPAAVSDGETSASSALIPELGTDFDHALVVHRCVCSLQR
jgi:hypothetical protein